MRAEGFNMVEDEGTWIDVYDVIKFVETTQHCYRKRAEKLVRDALDSGQARSRTVKGAPRWLKVTAYGGERYYPDLGPRTELLQEDVFRLWQEGKQPPPAQKTVPERKRPVQEAILDAIGALWANGIPRGLKPKERDNQIHKWCIENKKSVGKDATPSFSRAVQRLLKEHPELL
jgi:hypothetical protein